MFLIDYFRDKSEKRRYRKLLEEDTPVAYVLYLNKGNPSFLAKEDIISLIADKYNVAKEQVSINIEHVEADRPYESSYDNLTAVVEIKTKIV